MKLCKDCRYFRNRFYYRLALCKRDPHVSLVDGKVFYATCIARRNIGRCGPEGKDFEPIKSGYSARPNNKEEV